MIQMGWYVSKLLRLVAKASSVSMAIPGYSNVTLNDGGNQCVGSSGEVALL